MCRSSPLGKEHRQVEGALVQKKILLQLLLQLVENRAVAGYEQNMRIFMVWAQLQVEQSEVPEWTSLIEFVAVGVSSIKAKSMDNRLHLSLKVKWESL